MAGVTDEIGSLCGRLFQFQRSRDSKWEEKSTHLFWIELLGITGVPF